jgi:uncharacterized membrane protein YhiD involved in acid resistance
MKKTKSITDPSCQDTFEKGWASARGFILWGLLVLITAMGLASYHWFGKTQTQTSEQLSSQSPEKEDPFFSLMFGSDSDPSASGQESWKVTMAKVTLRLTLAAFLASLLAFRPHRQSPILQRNPYVAQTQILLAVVASALMMVVADNAARAFGIFAAAALVRFRTNIRDPKEITVLLVSLGIGLSTGVGKWELAIIFSLFVLLLLSVLELFEPAQIHRTLELKIRTHDTDVTHEKLKQIFDRHHFKAEIRELDYQDEANLMGKIVYLVKVNPGLSTERLSEEIFASDVDHVDSVEWHQKKSSTYMYR